MDSDTLIALVFGGLMVVGLLGQPFIQSIQNAMHGRAALPPRERELLRAGTGAGWLAFVVYVLATPMPGHVVSRNHVLIGVAVIAAWGCYCLAVGVKRSQGGRDSVEAARGVVEILIGGAGLWLPLLIPRSWGWALAPLLNFLLRGVWIYFLVRGVTIFVLAMRGMKARRLPDPSEVRDMPISGPASRDAAGQALRGRGGWQPPKFHN
jgi:hypothetical protein